MKQKHIIFPLSILMLLGCITSCNKLTFKQKLEKLDGISNIKTIENEEKYKSYKTCKEAYTFTINQPIDWNNKELGSFEQKINVYYNSDNAVTEFKCGGYAIFDDRPVAQYYNNELQERYEGNIVHIEYRFFAKSKPEGFSYDGTKYVNYLNSYQASKDFHNIVGKMKSILNGKTIFDGGSKGGYTTEMMAYYFPDDIDCYISYVAPLCNTDKDPNLFKYVQTSIGNKSYGEEQAQKYRDMVIEFQRHCLKEEFRNTIMEKLETKAYKSMTKDEMYESSICGFGIGLWQYKGPDDFERINTINNMPETTEEEKTSKINAIVKRLLENKDNSDPSYIDPYYLQAKMEMGNYATNLDYLREKHLNVKTLKEREEYISDHSLYTDEQLKVLQYTPTYRNALIDFYNTTKKDIIKIVGYNDPWYGVKAPVTTNTHIHLYEAKGNHTSGIKTLEEDKKNEAFGIVDKLVGYTK